MDATQGDLRPNLLAANIVTSVIALIALALRFVSRLGSRKSNLWWDDWSALASAPFIITFIGLNSWFVNKGLGLHLPVAEQYGGIQDWRFILYIENLIYNTGLSFVKLSVVLFYLRVFKDVRLYKYPIWFGAFLVVAWCVGNNFLAAFECNPVRAYWDATIPHTCIDTDTGFLGTTISNVLVDVYILVLPVPMLWRLQMTTKRKLGLIGVFICGYCVVIISIVRLVTIVGLGPAKDFTWDFVSPQMLVAIEPPIALTASCLPALFQLVKRLVEKNRFGTARSSQPLSANSTIRMGPLGNPVSQRGHKQFSQLDNSKDTDSAENLYKTSDEASQPGNEVRRAEEGGIQVTQDVTVDVKRESRME